MRALVRLTAAAACAATLCGFKDPSEPVRKRSQVEARGREVAARYSDPKLASYGILDVTKAPYSADPTGKRDSTAALQRAIVDARDARLATYLPPGVYLVSDTIECIQGVVKRDVWIWDHADPYVWNESYYFPCVLFGAGAKTRLVLKDRSPGFGDPQKPKPVIHYWARQESYVKQEPDPSQIQPNISFNQLIAGLSIVLGENPGAVGIDHQSAQGSSIQDVEIDARGAYAGVHRIPGSGGGIHGVTVRGGRYGILARDTLTTWRGSMPVPVLSYVTLTGQSEAAVVHEGRGPMSIVGALIDGAGILAAGQKGMPSNGAVSLIDSILRLKPGLCAVRSDRSVVLNNVFVQGAGDVVCVEGAAPLKTTAGGWTRVLEYAAGATVEFSKALGGWKRPDPVYIDGKQTGNTLVNIAPGGAPPPKDLRERHHWSEPLPFWLDPKVANVREAPYHAKGDGKSDDSAAIQKAIDSRRWVFLPKGEYVITKPLRLKPDTCFFGVTNLISVVTPLPQGEFVSAEHPRPLIDTEDSAEASTTLAFVEMRVPLTNPSCYALRWRAGRRSVVRGIHPTATFWHPDAPPQLHPMVRIESRGGGRWYDFLVVHWWGQSPEYRHLLVDGVSEPLRFYMSNPEHGRGLAQIEIRDSRNVDIYSLKSECSFTTLWVRRSRNVRLFGYGGLAHPWHGWQILRFDDSDDFLVANANPQLIAVATTPQPGGPPRRWNALVLPTHYSKWSLLEDFAPGRPDVRIPGNGQFVLYRRGKPAVGEP